MRAILLAAGVAAAPPPPLPSLPVIPRIHVEVTGSRAVVTQDVRLARGDWTSGDLDVWVAFGAPGVPRAFDAHLVALGPDELFASAAAPAEPASVERASRRPPRARLLLGGDTMAGVVVHLKEPAMRRAFAGGGPLVLRLRYVVTLEAGREVLVRLGAGDVPIALASIEVTAGGDVSGAEAHLCGPRADPHPLIVRLSPPRSGAVRYPRPASPLLVTRHPGDDLCLELLP